MSHVTLHPKYGVSPTIPTCFYCGESKREIVLLGIRSKRITGKDEAPMKGPVFSMEPCDKCAELMRQGVLFIECRDGETGQNPCRTGRQWVVKDEAVQRLLNSAELIADVLRKRVLFIEHATAVQIGLE